MTNIIGDSVRIEQSTLLDGVLTDPSSATLTITPPTGAAIVKDWPATPTELEHPSLGLFRYDLLLTQVGVWRWRFECFGPVANVTEGAFEALPLEVEVTIHVSVGLTNLADAAVCVLRDGTIVAGGITDSSGNFRCELRPGTYSVETRLEKHVFADVTTVISTAATVEVAGTALTITRGAPVATTRVYGFVSSGRWKAGVRVTVDYVGGGALARGTGSGVNPFNQIVDGGHMELTSAEDGYWEVDLVVGAVVRVAIPDLKFQKVFRVPSTTPLNIVDAREDPGTGRYVGVQSTVHDKEG